jgi:hypothetical protein
MTGSQMAVRLSALSTCQLSFTSREISGTHFSKRLNRLRAIVPLEGLGQVKDLVTSSGIKPTTFLLVTWYLNCYHVTYVY